MSESYLGDRVVRLEECMHAVLERNRKVEGHKAWETSKTRLVSITIVTYVTMILVFSVLGSSKPHLDALIPTTGFFLSTLSLPFIRKAWEARQSTHKE